MKTNVNTVRMYMDHLEEKRKAELKPFALSGDNFRKIVVRDDIGHRFFDDSGVLNISLVDFLQDSTGVI